jgi:hypothetical protein
LDTNISEDRAAPGLNPEDGCSMVLQKVNIQPPHYTEQQSRKPVIIYIFTATKATSLACYYPSVTISYKKYSNCHFYFHHCAEMNYGVHWLLFGYGMFITTFLHSKLCA